MAESFRECLFITDWKPSVLAFQVIDTLRTSEVPGTSLADMSEEQVKKIEELRVKIRPEKDKVEREMERQQSRIVRLAHVASWVRDGDGVVLVDGMVEETLEELLEGLERAADWVRVKTLKGALEVLNPLQCVDFLAAIFMLQIRLRKRRKKREKPIERE